MLLDGARRPVCVPCRRLRTGTRTTTTRPSGTHGNSFFKGDGYSVGQLLLLRRAAASAAASSTTTPNTASRARHLHRHEADEGPAALLLRDRRRAAPDAERRRRLCRLRAHSEIDPDRRGRSRPSTTRNGTREPRASSAPSGPISASALGVQVQNRDFSALGEGADYLLPTTTKSLRRFRVRRSAAQARPLHLQAGARVESVKRRRARPPPMCRRSAISRRSAARSGCCSTLRRRSSSA